MLNEVSEWRFRLIVQKNCFAKETALHLADGIVIRVFDGSDFTLMSVCMMNICAACLHRKNFRKAAFKRVCNKMFLSDLNTVSSQSVCGICGICETRICVNRIVATSSFYSAGTESITLCFSRLTVVLQRAPEWNFQDRGLCLFDWQTRLVTWLLFLMRK